MNIEDFVLWEGLSPIDLVAEFHTAFDHPVLAEPISAENFDPVLAEKRLRWMEEEIREAREAIAAGDLVGFADALNDLLYFVAGSFLAHGVPAEETFNAVHDANMAKLFPDGKPRYREGDGKVIKPEGWVGPEARIADILADAQDRGTPFSLAA